MQIAEDALSAPAEYTHSREIRTVAPAAVIVLEHDAPVRIDWLYSTPAEADVLVESLREDELVSELLARYFEGDNSREFDHVERLAAGHPLEDVRAV